MDQSAAHGEQARIVEAGCWKFLLFGRFSATSPAGDQISLKGRRIQELLGYILLFPDRPHHREVLADALWGEETWAADRKKQLRQALWQLQGVLRRRTIDAGLLRTDSEWIELEDGVDLWTDAAELEGVVKAVKSLSGERLSESEADSLRRGIDLYRADLLEGCYQNWCVYERERLKTIYLAALEKLLRYCEVSGLPEEGLVYGERLLSQDAAHELTHRRMMRLHWLAGDRVRALRQFQRCVIALHDELGVGPSARTKELFERIRNDSEYVAALPG